MYSKVIQLDRLDMDMVIDIDKYIYITIIFIFFSMMIYYRTLNIVPSAIR